ncbi:ASCH domain-containing protein [Sporomusa malonica]|uniref:ASCH domain-containing protein n=1 Tax=Sporomusa malonica TaxID=112901 RepID=A0A1W2AT20_9FIRM|nr:ASCH domain-containing protein [Sporomusa malonica]SMC63672.1 ASCH domain-containing protein [Sporomusa malonica]
MKAITILQPWASLIACGVKQIETRGWATKYRGEIAIHAGVGKQFMQLAKAEPLSSALKANGFKYLSYIDIDKKKYFLPFGAMIAIAEIVDCAKMVGCTLDNVNNGHKLISVTLENGHVVSGNELEFGDYTLGRYAWILANVRRIEPIPAKGMQRIWEWNGP